MAIVKGTKGDDQYPGELEGTAGADQIFGSDGLDLVSYKSSSEDVTVNLSELYAAGGDADGDILYGIEGVIGSAYGDFLIGNDQRNILRGEGGSDLLLGFEGNDRIEGGSGNDALNGGAGNDELAGGAGIDANDQVSSGQAFKFIGQGQFTGAGQLRFFHQNGDSIIEANTDDSLPGAEMRIELDPLVSLQQTDFVL